MKFFPPSVMLAAAVLLSPSFAGAGPIQSGTASQQSIVAVLKTGVEPDPRVRTALERHGLPYQITSAGDFKVDMSWADGRSHPLIVQSAKSLWNGTLVRKAYSPVWWSKTPFLDADHERMIQEMNTIVGNFGAKFEVINRPGQYAVLLSGLFPANLEDDAMRDVFRVVLIARDLSYRARR